MMREDFTNETKGHFISDDTLWYEPFTDNRKRLFRSCQRDYGRCVSSIYVDTPTGPKACGWYFERREEYTDARRFNSYGYQLTQQEFRERWTYIRGVWVHLTEAPDEPEPDDN
jgi:hypothetical protein